MLSKPVQKLLKQKGLEGMPKTGFGMLVQIRMYLGGAQPAVVKIPKKSLLAPLLSEEIVEQNKNGHRKLTKG